MQRQSPGYHRASFADNFVELSVIQDRLKEGSVLIEYLFVTDQLYMFVITSDTFTVFQNPCSADCLSMLSSLQTLITNRSPDKARLNRLDTLTHQAYLTLIQPVVSALNPDRRLIIIPDGLLHYIPFELFRVKGGSDDGVRDRDFLVYQYAFQYQSSIFLWLDQVQEETDHVQHFLVIAPKFDYITSGQKRHIGYSPLIYSEQECDEISALWGGRQLKGKHASKANFLRYAPKSDMIHFATHAAADERTGLFSWLAFSPTSPDSLIFLDEIYALSLDARMVVLSGCETGNGPLQTGEGLMSLSRAFTYAGAESIVTTLWAVQDAMSTQIMTLFYHYLKEGESKDRALQRAKLDYLNNISDPVHADPYYWAAFIAIGDMSPVIASSPGKPCFVWFGIVIGACLISLTVIWHWRKR